MGFSLRLVVVVLAAGAQAGAAAARSAPVCGPAAARTLAVSPAGRVYLAGNGVFGCARGRSQRYRLGSRASSRHGRRVGPVALSGVVVAFGSTQSGVDTVSASVVARRLTDGKRLHFEPAITRPVGPEFFETVRSVVAGDDGSMAWIATAGSIVSAQAREVEVNRVDASGRTLLDSGPGIDPASLRRRGARILWKHSGRTRAAALS